jgi:protein-L-isoaspartate(D-aspartate) O-methyltransferase
MGRAGGRRAGARMGRKPSLETVRDEYAAAVTRAAWVTNPRIERAFAAIPREAFLTPPPWRLIAPGHDRVTMTDDPAELYDDVLVVLDADRGINNGQPSLHAAWLDALDPKPGETAIHIGAGTGYYTALLAFLVSPGGRVEAFEIEAELAKIAAHHLAWLGSVQVHATSGVDVALPEADVIDVNAGVRSPDRRWLDALRPGGRLIFPWQPSGQAGITVLVRREPGGFAARPSMAVGFIPCTGASVRTGPQGRMGADGALAIRSLWRTGDRPPDGSAVAIYERVWFSRDPLP